MKKSSFIIPLFLSILTLLAGCNFNSNSSSSPISSGAMSSEISNENYSSSSSSEVNNSDSQLDSFVSSNEQNSCNHIYTNNCDSNCDLCGDERNAPHNCQQFNVVEASDFHYGLEVIKCSECSDYQDVSFIEPLKEDVSRPDITIKEYAVLASKKAREQAKELFDLVLENDQKYLFMMPYTTISRYKEIKDFTMDLTKECKTDFEKIETIYAWITKNIKYDSSAQNYPIYDTFKEKKGVCFGFTSLMHDMLSAVDIMSMYTSGYTQTEKMTFNDIYNYNRLKSYCHAWLLIYCDDKVIFADPTWGAYNIDSFNLTDEEIGETYVTIDTDEINVIPDEVDCRLYVNAMYKLGDIFINLQHGQIFEFSSCSIVRNIVKETNFMFHNKNDGYFHEGYAIEKAAYTNGLIYYGNMDDMTNVYYALVNGHSLDYIQVISYINILEREYGIDVEVEFENNYFVTEDNLVFRDKGDYLILSTYFGHKEKVTIPSQVNSKPVKIIGERAFEENEVIKEVIIPEGIEKIGYNAFVNTHNLVEVKLPNSLKAMDGAFNFSGIKELVIPEGVEEFYGVSGCHNLISITIPNMPISGNSIAHGCENLKEVKVHPTNNHCKVVDGVLYSKDGKTLLFYPTALEGEKYIIPEGVEVIGYNAFNHTEHLKEVVFPSSIKEIKNRGFYFSSIETIDIPESITKIGQETFYGSSLVELYLPDSILEIDNSAFQDCMSLEKINIPKNISNLFFGFNFGLKTIEISPENEYFKVVDSVVYSKDGTELLYYPMAKEGTEYTVLEGTKVLKNGAFSHNSNLEVINLPSSLEKIELGAFVRFEGEYLVIPENVKVTEMEYITQCYNLSIYYMWSKDDVPNGVYIHNNVLNYYLGEWEYIDGKPTPIS